MKYLKKLFRKNNSNDLKHFRIEPPEPDFSRFGVCITVMIKNEEHYIAEWINYHKSIGVRHFYFYLDNCEDATEFIIKENLDSDQYTIIPWAGRILDAYSEIQLSPQTLCFSHALLNFGSSYRWMAFIDVDEFLILKKHTSLPQALACLENENNISLPWHMFGTSGHIERPKNGTLESYTSRYRFPSGPASRISNFKCIVDPCDVTEVYVHSFKTKRDGSSTSNDVGYKVDNNERKNVAFYSCENIQLNHYYTRSKSEFEKRLDRGSLNSGKSLKVKSRMKEIFNIIENDLVEDKSAIKILNSLKK